MSQTMNLDPTFAHLLNVLEDRKIDVGRAEVEQSLGDQGCEGFAIWIGESLDQQTLLSADEAAL